MKATFKNKGFTLLELLLVIGVIGILAAVAMPNFVEMMSRMSANSATKSVISTLNLARSEAIKRGQNVTVCASTDGQDCSAAAWSQGWIVFVDNNNDADGATGSVDNGDELVQVYEPLIDMNLSISPVAMLEFTSRGYGDNGGEVTMDICPDDGNISNARRLLVGVSGRTRLIEGEGCP